MFEIFNTLKRSKEPFIPLTENTVSFYQCGPTVYWTQHIGNMRAMVLSDLMRRSFEFSGYTVTFVRNYTDVGHLTGDNDGDADQGEDRMEQAATREASTPEAIATKYTKQFEDDVARLNIPQPTHAPRATDYIPHMIDFVDRLLQAEFAYATPYAIYFDTTKAADYTKLSKQNLDQLQVGSGTGTISDPNKKNPADFALWFFKAGTHEHALQTWESPFVSELVENGAGFPGWHLECSTFIESLLGDTIDIHMGGIEHIPIHHTNEIAQSESLHNTPLANVWLHNEHLTVDGGKMSKSSGTSYTLDDVIAHGHDPLSLRYFFIQAHYRSQQNFTWDALAASETALKKLKAHATLDDGSINTTYRTEFESAIHNDFNFPEALGVAWKLVKDASIPPSDVSATLREFDRVLGLDLATIPIIEIPATIQKLIEKREKARSDKDWGQSDELRDQILDAGFVVSDGPDGPEITPR